MEIQSRGYEHALSLRELLSGIAPDKLSAALMVLLNGSFRLLSANGECVMGAEMPFAVGGQRVALHYDLETIATLEAASATEPQLRAAANLLEQLMQSAARYFMASAMHLEVVKSDYEELQLKHSLLLESESRYKLLAENLEQRVKQQVKTIDSAQRQLYQAEKMAAVGTLAAGMAHEINNPIGFIRSNLSMALKYVQKFPPIGELIKTQGSAQLTAAWQDADLDFVLQDFVPMLQESISGADRVARIVADLKGFSNIDEAEEKVVNLNDNIRAACNVAASQINSRAELKLTLGELPPLRCKPGHLNQVFLNLLLNAANAIPVRGEIHIHSSVEDKHICIRISDTGSGIPVAVLSRIFDPFFTTHDVGAGTGLGLTVSRDIIVAHGGRITVASELGVGTTFTIYLPLV